MPSFPTEKTLHIGTLSLQTFSCIEGLKGLEESSLSCTLTGLLQTSRAVSKEVISPNQPLVIALLHSLPQLPPVPRLQQTAALTLGSFAPWMASALDQGVLSQSIPQLLQMLSAGKHEASLLTRYMFFTQRAQCAGMEVEDWLPVIFSNIGPFYVWNNFVEYALCCGLRDLICSALYNVPGAERATHGSIPM